VPAALLSGCVNLAPSYTQPAAPVPAAWASAQPARARAFPRRRDLGWRDFFTDARLRSVVELTLANNRDLRVSALNIERARAQYGVSRAGAFPRSAWAPAAAAPARRVACRRAARRASRRSTT
jgi:multidrug efflux system outer membrane protein